MGLKLNRIRLTETLAILFLMAGISAAQTALSLEDAIRLSGEHSYSVEAARSDSIAGIYDLGAARAMRYPTASLSATSFYINALQEAALPFGGASLTIGTHDNYQADFRLSLPLWTGGKISNQVNLQGAITESKGANLEAARLNDAYNVRKAYLGLVASQALAKSAEASLERVHLIEEDTQNRYSNGLADSVDLLDGDLAYQRGVQANEESATMVANSKALLARMVGIPAESIAVSNAPPDPDIQIYQDHGPAKNSINRAELKAQDSRIRAAQFAVSLNRAGYYPTLSGFGGYSLGKPNRNMLQSKWNDYWTTGLNLNWDFNLGNKTWKTVSSAKQAANSARAMKKDLEDGLYLQASTTYDNLLLAYRNYNIVKKEFEIAQRQYDLGSQMQKAGSLSLYRLLELESDLTSSEQLFQASTVNYYLSETEYLYAIGSPKLYGGFSK